jgi:hypothetical protein
MVTKQKDYIKRHSPLLELEYDLEGAGGGGAAYFYCYYLK